MKRKSGRRKAQIQNLEEDARRYIWHPFTQMAEWEKETPLIIERGEGVYLFDVYGKRYLDGVSSIWVNLHGHRKAALDRAVKNQINKIAHSTLLGLTHRPAIRLAKKLVALAPQGLAKVFFSDNGSTAMEVALKIASVLASPRQTRQDKIPVADQRLSWRHRRLGQSGWDRIVSRPLLPSSISDLQSRRPVLLPLFSK